MIIVNDSSESKLTEKDYIEFISSSLRYHHYDEAILYWNKLWSSGCRNPHTWIRVVDLFEPYNMADRIFPIFLIIALELGIENIWILVLLARTACAAGLHSTGITLCNRALDRGVTDPTKWHLIRCLYFAHIGNGQFQDALDTFVRSFSLIPLISLQTAPVKHEEAAQLCVRMGRPEWSAILRQGRLPEQLDVGGSDLGVTGRPRSIATANDTAGIYNLLTIPATHVKIEPPSSLNEILPLSSTYRYFSRTYRPEINFYRIDNVKIIGQGGAFCVISENGDIISDVSNICRNNRSTKSALDLYNSIEKSGKVNSVNFLGMIRDSFPSPNICHFLLDHMSRLFFFEESGVDLQGLKILGPNFSAKFQSDAMEIMGILSDQILPTKDIWAYQCRHAYIPDNVALSYTHPAHLGASWALGYLRRRILSAESGSDFISPIKLYVSREKANGRRIKNEDDMRSLVERFGFKTIYAEELCFRDQVNIFSRATHVIAPHGAGLTNIVFCRVGAKILELFHPFYASDAYFYSAKELGFDYRIACDSTVNLDTFALDRNYGRSDFVAPLDVIEQWLNE